MTNYNFTVTRGRFTVRTLKEVNISEETFVSKILKFYVGEKEGDAIIPALLGPCPATCRNKTKGAGLDCGGNGPHRLSGNVRAMTMLGADIDDVTPERFDAVLARLRSLGLKFAWWHTHSYVPASGLVRARVLIPFDVPLELRHPAHWSRTAWPALMEHIGIAYDATDTTCKDPARVFYSPRKPSEDSPHCLGFEDGKPLSWREVLGDALDKLPEPGAYDVIAGPSEDVSRPVDIEGLREILKGSRNEFARKAGRGLSLTPPPGRRQAGEPSRYEAWRAVTGVLSLVTDGWESSVALLELLRPSWQVEVTESPDDYTDFDTIVDLLSSARASAPAKKAQSAAEEKAAVELLLRRASLSAKKDEEKALALPSPAIEALEPEEPWDSELTFTKGRKDEGPKLRNTIRNASVILSKHPQWAGMLRKNLLNQDVEVWGGPLLRAGQTPGRQFDDDDVAFTQLWLSKHYDIEPSSATLWSVLLAIGAWNAYDPLKDYLSGLQWDGVPRLDSWLQKYTGAPSTDIEGTDISSYLAAVGKKWAISAVARALQPGCKVDTVLAFEGMQGKKKSTMFSALGGSFFSDSPIDFRDKDSLAMLTRFWIIELPEMDSLHRSEVATQRAFLSRRIDDYRAAYARTLKRCPRRCVFVGTVNEDDYLRDEAGNRRHWPVLTGDLDVDGLASIRDQFWAEAVARFQAGEIWYLTDEEQARANGQTAHRQTADLMAEQIASWVTSKPQDKRVDFVSALTVCQEALGESPTRGLEMRLSRALRRCGFTRTRRGGLRGYLVPQNLLEAPSPAQRQGLRALPGMK